MKHKAFLIVLLLLVTFGTAVLADYVEPTGTAPASNTGEVLKTGPKNTNSMTYEKIGIGDGTSATISNIASQGWLYLTAGSYAGSGVGDKGVKPDRLVVTGATGVVSGKDFIVRVDPITGNEFDQFKNNSSFKYDKFINNNVNPAPTTPKPLEAFVAGRYISNFAITNSSDITTNSSPNTYSLELREAGSFDPTTNIGLGNSCNLYPADLGNTIGDGGGCPAGTYMTRYIGPSYSGTLSSTNNTNTQVVATCTEFNPSINPTSGPHCSTGRTFSNAIRIGKDISSGSVCLFTISSGTSFTNSNVPANFNGKNVKIRWYALGGNPARAYINTLDNQKTFTYGCAQDSWEAEVYDDYGQYFNITR